jgi:HSP20 family molecular chaperone IbpA
MANSKELEKRGTSEVKKPEDRGERFMRPRTSIHEYEEYVRIMVDMPGVSKDRLDINFNRGELVVIGRRDTWEKEAIKPVYCERFDGNFRRVFALDNSLDPGKIDAKLVNGVLLLSIPKRESEKPRKIEIKSA